MFASHHSLRTLPYMQRHSCTYIYTPCTYIHPDIHTYMHTYLHIHVHTYVLVHTCTYPIKYDSKYAIVYFAHTHTHTHAHTHAHTCTHTCIHTCSRTHVHTAYLTHVFHYAILPLSPSLPLSPDLLDRMGVWILDGVVWHSQLLPFVLTRDTIHHTTVMIVVDLSQPWGIMESLQRWAEVVRKHIQSLRLPDRELRDMEEKSECGRAVEWEWEGCGVSVGGMGVEEGRGVCGGMGVWVCRCGCVCVCVWMWWHACTCAFVDNWKWVLFIFFYKFL